MTSANPIQGLTDHDLLMRYETALHEQTDARRRAGLYEQEIRARLRTRDASAIPDPVFECKAMKKRNYERSQFTPLKEVFSGSDLAICYEPQHFETVDVPEKWDMVKVLPLVRQYGQEAAAVLSKAELEPTVSLTFKRKEVKA